MEIKRNKDGSIKGVLTLGDMITKEQPTKEEQEIKKKRAELERKYGLKP